MECVLGWGDSPLRREADEKTASPVGSWAAPMMKDLNRLVATSAKGDVRAAKPQVHYPPVRPAPVGDNFGALPSAPVSRNNVGSGMSEAQKGVRASPVTSAESFQGGPGTTGETRGRERNELDLRLKVAETEEEEDRANLEFFHSLVTDEALYADSGHVLNEFFDADPLHRPNTAASHHKSSSHNATDAHEHAHLPPFRRDDMHWLHTEQSPNSRTTPSQQQHQNHHPHHQQPQAIPSPFTPKLDIGDGALHSRQQLHPIRLPELHDPASARLPEVSLPSLQEPASHSQALEAAHEEFGSAGFERLPELQTEAAGVDIGLRKTITKKAKRRFQPKNRVTSRFCHLCLCTADDNNPPFACSNVLQGTCRKMICRVCLVKAGRDVDQIRAHIDSWVCSHCSGVCPIDSPCRKWKGQHALKQNTSGFA